MLGILLNNRDQDINRMVKEESDMDSGKYQSIALRFQCHNIKSGIS